MARGFVYLAAVVDWFTRRVLAWRLSITMEVDFCCEAVEDALAQFGRPEIFNTDQGAQFTSAAFTGLLLENKIAISMDGRGSWRDNVFVERLWRSVKYEEVYLRAYDSVGEARMSLGKYLVFYNALRPRLAPARPSLSKRRSVARKFLRRNPISLRHQGRFVAWCQRIRRRSYASWLKRRRSGRDGSARSNSTAIACWPM
jgi:transposase InsO family protein